MSIKKNLIAIALVKKLQENLITLASTEEKQILAKFNEWGAMWRVFQEDHPQHQELKSLLTPEEFSAASASTLNAHYTSPPIVDTVWKIVEHLGLGVDARILEPSCGIGYFISEKPDRGEWIGVELDPIPAAIAHYLNPQAKIYNKGFEAVSFPDGYFDLAIRNVPFGSYSVYEPRYSGLLIHNYFILKSVDLVGDGGLIALITSTGSMDTPGNRGSRESLAEKARLIAAFRMPMGTMANAKTDVTTDLLIFQKGNDRTQKLNWLQMG